MNSHTLAVVLRCAAVLQLGIALLNLFLIPLLHWRPDLDRMPLLLREVFQVHAWFISVTLVIFGSITWRFAEELAVRADPVGQWLAVGIGSFWAIRAVLQVTYYSSIHWRGRLDRTAAHVLLLIIYSGFVAIYLLAGLPGGKS